MTVPVAIAHDYLTQRGGAERVVLELAAAFPGAPIVTSLYEPAATWEGFAALDVRPGPLDRSPRLRRTHRLALPLLARAWERTVVDAELTICSSSGWAHGVRATGRKVVYCHTPARWLYQPHRYLRGSGPAARHGMAALGRRLRRWDRAAAASADAYVANSTVVRDRIRDAYGRDAEIVFPPMTVDVAGPAEPDPALAPGFVLAVSRLLPYKNVDAVLAAAALDPARAWVVAGDGPLLGRLRATAPGNARLVGPVSEARLRWLYRHAAAVVSASHEDFGLVPVEAAAFGTPTAALRWGGHLDTIREGETGLFFDTLAPAAVATVVQAVAGARWDGAALSSHAARFSPERFRRRLRDAAGLEPAR